MDRIMSWVRGGITLVCFGLVFVTIARAQNTADVVGTVTDTSGAVVPGATVTLTNTGTNITQTTEASGSGDYAFALVQVGAYSVKVEAKGFKTFVAPSLTVSSGDRARVDAKMEVGEQSTTVEVQATSTPALQTDTSSIGTLVTSRGVEDLPLNGRNIVKLVQLSAGVTEGTPNSIAGGTVVDDRRQTSAFSVNGQIDSENNNMVDGMDNNERLVGTIGVKPSIDAIQEVNVSTNKYDSSVGRTGGGVVDIITKSGTNNFHGSAFEFFRNKVLNTNPNYAFSGTSAPNPPFRQNQWGASIGGPIRKDKTFFFADYEGFSSATGTAATVYTVPTYCERGLGSSSPFAKPCPDGKVQVGDFSDTNLISALNGGSTLGGPGPDITPTSTLGLAFFNMYPLPNAGTAGVTVNNYVSSPSRPQTLLTYDGRIDQHFSDKDMLYGRFTYDSESTLIPNGFPDVCLASPVTGALAGTSPPCGGLSVHPNVSSFAGPNHQVEDALAFSYVHVFNPNLLLNLKAGALRASSISQPVNQGTNLSTKLGFPCNATSCINFSNNTTGLTRETVTSINGSPAYTAVGDPTFMPTVEFDTAFQYMAALTWNKNAHSVRFGLGLIRRRGTIGQSSNPQGSFTFTGAYTGVALGDLLEGLPVTMTRTNVLYQPSFRTWEPSFYVQDDWRARPWLTLNIGVRYDIFTPYTEVHGRLSNYDPYIGLVASPSLPGLQQSSPTGYVQTNYGDVSPRLGFAATLAHKTVIRGGFGLTYFQENYQSPAYMKNAPYNYAPSCTAQNEIGSANSCATAQYDGPVGQFANAATPHYGAPVCLAKSGAAASALCPVNFTANSASNVAAGGGPAGSGGALLSAGLPLPVLNVALATNPASYAGTSIGAFPINNRDSYIEQMNLQVQKEIGGNVISIGYVGELGRFVGGVNTSINENLAANPTENSALPLTVGGSTAGFGELPGFPYLATTTVTEAENHGSSSYQALQTALVRRFSRGLTVNFNYTWSHNMTNVNGGNSCVASMFATIEPCFEDSSNGVSAANPHDVIGYQQYGVGNATQDVHDRFAWAADYQLPFGKSMTGIEGGILKDWGVNASGSWQTGLPFQVSASSSNSNIAGTQLVDQTCSGRLAHPTLTDWFNYNCFVQPAAGTLGNQRANQFFGPPQRRFDFSLFKEFPVKEQLRLQFRTEVFNLFNSPNFNVPSGTAIAFNSNGTVNLTGSHATTGGITAMNGNWNQREIQFALKLIF
jgi:hypothetical protein